MEVYFLRAGRCVMFLYFRGVELEEGGGCGIAKLAGKGTESAVRKFAKKFGKLHCAQDEGDVGLCVAVCACVPMSACVCL